MRTLTMLKVPAGFIAAVLAVASLAPAAQALDQDPGFAARMNVPFAFQTATGQHFNPGIYTIRMNSQQTMLIRGTGAAGLVMTQVAGDGLPAAFDLFPAHGQNLLLAVDLLPHRCEAVSKLHSDGT